MSAQKFISNSEIQVFKDCRRKWWLSYYLRLRKRDQDTTGALALGTHVHTALAGWYQDGIHPVESIEKIYGELIDSVEPDLEGFQDTTAVRKDAELAKIMVEGYVQWVEETGQDIGLKFIGVEEALSYEILENVWLRGKLDARFTHEEFGPMFMDHKTVVSLEQARTLLPINEQMKFYALLEVLVYGKERQTNGVLVNMLRKVKRTARATPPFYERAPVPINQKILESMWLRTHTAIREIMEAINWLDADASHHIVVPPRPDLSCTWRCEFFKVCPMFDDGSNAEGILRERYEEYDPNERYQDVKGFE